MPSVRRRLISAAVVLTVGILSALPFYRTAPETGSTTNPPPSNTPDSSPPANRALQVPATDLSSAVVTEDAAQFVSATEITNNPPLPKTEISNRSPRSIPELSNTHPQAREAVPPAAPVRRVVEGRALANGSELAASTDDKRTSPRMHWIRDGDTLEELAFRFLGDRLRWREILDANRDVLTTADILPIGKQIRIPAKERGTAAAPVQSFPSQPLEPVSPPAERDSGLVPIPWSSK